MPNFQKSTLHASFLKDDWQEMYVILLPEIVLLQGRTVYGKGAVSLLIQDINIILITNVMLFSMKGKGMNKATTNICLYKLLFHKLNNFIVYKLQDFKICYPCVSFHQGSRQNMSSYSIALSWFHYQLVCKSDQPVIRFTSLFLDCLKYSLKFLAIVYLIPISGRN